SSDLLLHNLLVSFHSNKEWCSFPVLYRIKILFLFVYSQPISASTLTSTFPLIARDIMQFASALSTRRCNNLCCLLPASCFTLTLGRWIIFLWVNTPFETSTMPSESRAISSKGKYARSTIPASLLT